MQLIPRSKWRFNMASIKNGLFTGQLCPTASWLESHVKALGVLPRNCNLPGHQHTLLRARDRNCLESARDFFHLYTILQSTYIKGQKLPEASNSVRPLKRKFIHFTPTQQRIHSSLFTSLNDRIKLRVQIAVNRSWLRKATFCWIIKSLV